MARLTPEQKALLVAAIEEAERRIEEDRSYEDAISAEEFEEKYLKDAE
jgi:hypothetical protein